MSETTITRRPWSPVATVGLIWLAAIGLISVAFLYAFGIYHAPTTIDEWFVLNQDAAVAGLFLGLYCLIALPVVRFGPSLTSRCVAAAEKFAWRWTLAAAAAVAVVGFAGWWWVLQAYPLSMDEFWAMFDARIFRHGQLMAPLAPAWRPYAPALQPMWRLETPSHAFWVSTYLPMNAAFRALFGLMGSQALAGPAWSALSVVLTFDLARRLWPDRRDAAFVAAILLASSSQLVILAMTAYAMPAHLAFNLAWLWLFLHKNPWRQAAAMAVAFIATGLHQWVFPGLFAAPWVLQLWLQRRWRMAALWTATYAASCLFWIAWPSLLLLAQHMPLAAVLAAQRSGATAYALARMFSPAGVYFMAENLLRLTTWQNPLALPLALIAVRGAVRERSGQIFVMACSLVLAVVFLTLVTPVQGHGWGYRYLHGYLGVICLLAADTWVRFTDSVEARRRGWAALVLATGVAILIVLPWRAWQAAAFTAPYARASAAIQAARADVVVVDPAHLSYADDLVRNDPFLQRSPKVMHLVVLRPDQIATLCVTLKVKLFDATDGAVLGIPEETRSVPPPRSALLAAIHAPACGGHVGAR